jgi:carbonic anhydrase
LESSEIALTLKKDTHVDYTTATIQKLADTIKIDAANGEMKLTFDSGDQSEFKLAQFHFHSPSEHTHEGYSFDLEVHFVHAYLDGSFGAVIGVFFDR